MLPSLNEVAARLEALRTPSAEAVERRLASLRSFLQIRTVVAEITPIEFNSWMLEHPTLYPSQLDGELLTNLGKSLVEYMSKVFPINDYWMEELLAECENGEIPIIPIQPCNLITNWDEFDEVLDNPIEIEKSEAVKFFAFLLSYSVTNDETWQAAAEHFGWPAALAVHPKQARGNVYLDSDAFYLALEAAGLKEFVAPFRMSMFDTKTSFLDMDDERVMSDPIEFSANAVLRLKAEWTLADAILKDAERATALAQENPQLYLDVLELYEAALHARTETNHDHDDNEGDPAGYDGDDDDNTE